MDGRLALPFEGVQRPIGHIAQTSHQADDSPYRVMCPTCGANPFHWCVSRKGTQSTVPHIARVDKADSK